jgi:flagella basal body P-ring formation protein FlgA
MGKIVRIGVIFLWLLSLPVLAADITVTVNPENVLTGMVIRLGDLATITGDDSDTIKLLQEMKLGNSPWPGTHQVLTAEVLAGRLTAAGADMANITWKMPPLITIATAGQKISGDVQLQMVTAAVRERLGNTTTADQPEWTVTPMIQPAAICVPLGQPTYKTEIPDGIHYNSLPTTATIAITVDGRYFTTVSVKVNVKAYRNVLVVTHNMGIDEVIKADGLRLERWDINRLVGAISDADKVIGLKVRRPLAAGNPLCDSAIEQPVVIKQGTLVTIEGQAGDIVVTASGQAMQDGSQGSIIKVKNISSSQIISAKVIDGATVQVITSSGK